MAVIALDAAASGLSALSTALDVVANNLANANTQGYKASRPNFEDLLYEELAQPGVENANGDQRPTGLYVGLGTRVSGTQLDFSQGPAESTTSPFDVYIAGRGFFEIEVEDDLGEGLAYTRAGNFVRNADGELVLANSEGYRLSSGIVVDEDVTAVSIASDGTVQVTRAGSTQLEDIGQIELATFVNPTGLKQIGGNLYLPTIASGDASLGIPGTDGRGTLQQFVLEGSNVEPVKELVNLIKTQRSFELNSQAIQAADEALQNINNMRRF